MVYCPTCNNPEEKRAVCENCIRRVLKDFAIRHDRYKASLHTAIAKAEAYLLNSNSDKVRILRAQQAESAHRLNSIKQRLFSCHASIRQKTNRVATLREGLARRRTQLTTVKGRGQNHHTSKHDEDPFLALAPAKGLRESAHWNSQNASLNYEWAAITEAIVEARRTLVRTLFDIYHIQNMDDEYGLPSPSLAPEAVFCLINGCFLPPVSDLKRYPSGEISAAVSHFAHLIRLLALYLGLRLPFHISAGPKITIRSALMTAWHFKWPGKYPLYLEPTLSAVSNAPVTQINEPSVSESHLISFVHGLSMLYYNALFICSAIKPRSAFKGLQTMPENVVHATMQTFQSPDWTNDSHATACHFLREISFAGRFDFASFLESNLKSVQQLQEIPLDKKRRKNMNDVMTDDWHLVDKS